MKEEQQQDAGSRQHDMRSPPLAAAVGTAALVYSLGSVFSFIVLYVLRLGSDDAAASVAGLMAQCILPVLVGAAILSLPFARTDLRNVTFAVGTIAVLLVPCVAIYSRLAAGFLSVALGLLSLALLFRNKDFVRRISLGALVFNSGIVAVLVLISADPSRFFLPEQMALGISGPDHLYHGAIAQMIAHYGKVSTGADDLAYHQYYFLSHAVAAGLSKLSHASVPAVYLFWGGVSLKIQLFWGIFIASLLLDKKAALSESGIMPWVIFAWLVAVLTRAIESESFALAMAFFLVLLPTLCDLSRQRDRAPLLIVFVAVAGAFICAMTKASVGFFVAVALLGAAWRLKRFPAILLGIVASLLLLAIVTLRYLSPVNNLLIEAGWNVLLVSYWQYLDGVALISFVFPLVLLLVAAWQPCLSSSKSGDAIEWRLQVDRAAPRQGSTLKSWAVWLLDVSSGPIFFLGLSLIACTAVLLTVPVGSNAAYFSLVLLVLASVLAPATLRPRLNLGMEKQVLRRMLFGFALLLSSVMALQFAWGTKNAVSTLYRSAFSARPNFSMGNIVVDSLRTHRSLLTAVREQSSRTPWSRLTQDILSKTDDGSALAVHTSPDVTEFWTRLSPASPWWCITSHLMIPAELGLVQIRNIAPRSIETQCVSEGVSFYGFGKTQDAHRTMPLSNEQLCGYARQSRVRRIYVVNSISDLQLNVVLNCP